MCLTHLHFLPLSSPPLKDQEGEQWSPTAATRWQQRVAARTQKAKRVGTPPLCRGKACTRAAGWFRTSGRLTALTKKGEGTGEVKDRDGPCVLYTEEDKREILPVVPNEDSNPSAWVRVVFRRP